MFRWIVLVCLLLCGASASAFDPVSNISPTGPVVGPVNVTVVADTGPADAEIRERLNSHRIYLNGTRIYTSTTERVINHTITSLGVGTHSIYSEVVNNFSQTFRSSTNTIVVLPANNPPSVGLNGPSGVLIAPATIGLSANATDSDGTVVRVEFFANGGYLGDDTSAPFALSWSGVAVGSYSVTARATDNGGAQSVSAPLSVNVAQSQITGAIDGIRFDPSTGYQVTGWACSTGRNEPIPVHLYVGGPAGGGTAVGAYTANLGSEPAVAAACQASGGSYRFSIPLTSDVRQAHANKKIYVHGISPVGASNALVQNSGVFSVPAPLTLTRRYVYDQHGQLCKVIEPETGATVMDYDGSGNLQWSASGLQLLDPASCDTVAGRDSGRKVARYYDARNRLRELHFPDGRGNQAWSYTADGLPRQIETYNAASGGEKVVNLYDYNRRRMLAGESITQPGWYTWGIGYGYDANGSLAAHTYPTGLVIGYSPNALGQATQARDQSGATYASGVRYYPNGAVKQFTYGNGVTHTMTQNARQLPARSIDSGVLDLDTRFDANGNASDIYDVVRGGYYDRHLQYDGLDRLTAAGSWMFGGDGWHRFTYDALDNLRSWKLAGVKDYANYYYEPGTNRLTSIINSANSSIVGLGYDVQGNLANKNGVPYEFDYGNRLRQVVGKESYRYDGHGRRVLNARPSTITVSQYSHSGQVMYQQQTDKGDFEHIYLAGSLLATRNNGVVKYQHTDALGSPVAVTNAAGQVTERTDWEPYGAAIGKPNYEGIGFTGHVQDAATGLTYMQQRYYDPGIGRFLSVDPVTADGNTGGNFNRYWYANNNPYRFTDPDGRQAMGSPREMMNPITEDQARMLLPIVADFTPGVGDIKGGIDAYNNPTPANIASAVIGLFGPIGDIASKAIKGGDKAISMEKAIEAGIEHVGSKADVVMTKGGNVQFTSTTTDGAGNTVTKNARFDVNPSSAHVQKQGPHLNLETQVNGKKTGIDPHTPIKSETVRRGDYD